MSVDTAVRLLAGRLSNAVDSCGRVPGRVASRVLESALTLRLTGRSNRPLVAYLENAAAQPGSTALDRALIDGVLHGRVADDSERILDEILKGFDHFSAARKRLLLLGCLHAAGAAEVPPGLEVDRIRTSASNVHWVNTMLESLRVILGGGHGLRALPVWENHVTAYLLALIAADRPGDGLDRVLACQNPDGGIPGIARLEPFTTGRAGLALARSGVADRDVLERMGDYLSQQQSADGGWGFGEGTMQSDVDTTSYAVQFLRTLGGSKHELAVTAAGDYLGAIANPDGGFPTYVRGGNSEIAMTAGAVAALSPAGRHRGVVARGVRFMLDGQRPDGTFECGWSLSEANATWRVLQALRAAPETCAERAVTLACARLSLSQNDDGGWGQKPGDASDVTSTAYSILSLVEGGADEPALARAERYLLGQIYSDGSVHAPPDQVAPRPLPFDAPVFTEIWALLALSALRDRATR